MSSPVTLCLVLLAVYGLTNLLLSILVALLWSAGFYRVRCTSRDLLALRLIPSAGALLLTLIVFSPAFLIFEPAHETEQVGPLLVALGMYALATAADGLWRGWRAYRVARAFLRTCRRTEGRSVTTAQTADILDVSEPIVAVVGAWQPRIVAARSVIAACDPEEFRQVIAHEAAHLSAHDNLKLLLLIASPDALAWLPAGDALTARWRAAAELEADERACGRDCDKRLALASALIKVARLTVYTARQFPALSMSIALDDVEVRVRQLLSRSSNAHGKMNLKTVVGALLIPALAMPFLGLVHRFMEVLVAVGR